MDASTIEALNCIDINSAERLNSGLWTDIWNDAGACTDMSVNEYFKLVVDSYNSFNANVRLATRTFLHDHARKH